MSDTIFRTRVMVLFLLSLGIFVVWILFGTPFASEEQTLKVHFLDVGQGDAIFIQTPDGVEVLIDGGPNNSVLRGLSQQMSFFDRNIDMIIGTHPDADHIGGLVDVLERYNIKKILTTENEGSSAVWSRYAKSIKDEGADILIAQAGQVYTLGASTTLSVFFPVYNASDMESNVSSIVVQIKHGQTSLLLSGDAPIRIEEYLVEKGIDLQSDVLKLGHHGSRTSTSERFLKAVDPQYAVISSGKDNRYGHPHVEVMDLLQERKIDIYNTANEGSITFESDGNRVWKQ